MSTPEEQFKQELAKNYKRPPVNAFWDAAKAEANDKADKAGATGATGVTDANILEYLNEQSVKTQISDFIKTNDKTP